MDVGHLTCICSIVPGKVKGGKIAVRGGGGDSPSWPYICRLKPVDIIASRASGSSLSVSRVELFFVQWKGLYNFGRRV